MHILFVVPGWPKNSFWDVLYFKFPPLSLATLAGLTPSRHTLSYADESISPVDFKSRRGILLVREECPGLVRGVHRRLANYSVSIKAIKLLTSSSVSNKL